MPLSALEIVEIENEYQLIVQVEGPSQLVSDLSRQLERELSGFKVLLIDNVQSAQLAVGLPAGLEFAVDWTIKQ